MKQPERENENEENEEKVTKLKVIEGGRTGFDSGSTDKNWLQQLEEGTVFLAKDRSPMEFLVAQYKIVEHLDINTRLLVYLPNGMLEHWVNATAFCNKNRLEQVIAIVKQEEENDDDGDRF